MAGNIQGSNCPSSAQTCAPVSSPEVLPKVEPRVPLTVAFPAPHRPEAGPLPISANPAPSGGAGLQQTETSSKNENKSLHSSPELFYTPCPPCPQPPQKPSGHWSLRPQMSQGPSEGFSGGTGISLHANQGLDFLLTSVQPPWPKGVRSRSAAPRGGVEPPVSQPPRPGRTFCPGLF